MEERKPIHKYAARLALFSVAAIFFALLIMRFLFIQQKKQIISLYISRQEELAKLVSRTCEGILLDAASSLKSFGIAGVDVALDGRVDAAALKKLFANLRGSGALDIVAVDSYGDLISASGYMNATGMSRDDQRKFFRNIVHDNSKDTYISEIIQVDYKKKRDYVIVVEVPFRTAFGDGFSGSGGAQGQGILAAVMSVSAMNSAIQKLERNVKTQTVFVLDRNGFFVSHSYPEFIGAQANDALNLSRYERLQSIIERLKKGEAGTDWYTAPDNSTGRKDTRWLIVYRAVGGGGLSSAVTFQESDVPFLKSMALKRFSLSFIVIIAVAAIYVLFLREKHRFLDLESNATRLGDAAAVNEMLCTINSDLTEEKRKIETHLDELKTLHREREARFRNLVELQEHLENTIRRPTRGQRNLLNEITRELKLLLRFSDNRSRRKPEKEHSDEAGVNISRQSPPEQNDAE